MAPTGIVTDFEDVTSRIIFTFDPLGSTLRSVDHSPDRSATSSSADSWGVWMSSRILLCDCAGSQSIDGGAIERATGLPCSKVYSNLCTRQIDRAAEAISNSTEPLVVCCQQEARTFEALAEELGAAAPAMVDIRDRAGWSDEGKQATPKIAALLAAGQMRRSPEKTIDVNSEGMCLIIGASAAVLPAAEQLSELLSVTCLLSDSPEISPGPDRRFDIALGRVRKASGAFGHFEVTVDQYRPLLPEGRGTPVFAAPRDGGESSCDIILDLTGGQAFFPADHKRDGYLRADPGSIQAVQKVMFEASHLVGTFEKTLHVTLEESLCAHSRAGQIGCTRCLDVCPTGAILPSGDVVTVDANICAGCGACSAVCPSGAISYDAPPVREIFDEIRTLADVYRKAGGTAPRLLLHDEDHGRALIGLAARFGSGLPANVVPLQVPSLAVFGHAEMMVALASGFASVQILLSPRTERGILESQVALCNALVEGLGAGAERVSLLDVSDPDTLCDVLYDFEREVPDCQTILPLGSRRDATRLAAKALATREATGPVPLPSGAPYGAVQVDVDACTLCLSCAGLCPSGALLDNPDSPQLLFREDACLQCGLCANICPEDAITLIPQFDISDAVYAQQVVKEEEPFPCIECGKLFGVKGTIERIVERLEGHHSMFKNSDNVRLIRMCDDCRVKAQYHDENSPFRAADRPRVRTTDDYLNKSD